MAEHVVSGCTKVTVLPAQSKPVEALVVATAEELDLAILKLESPMDVPPLTISGNDKSAIDDKVTTWGFPEGYRGRNPLLSVGY